jgi:hypothetical protein
MAISSIGTTLSRWDSVGSNWELLSGVISLGIIDAHKEVISVVKLNSTGGVKSFIQGEIDYGTITLSINYTKEVLDIFIDDFQNTSENQKYMILLPDNTFIEFEGFISDMPFTAELDSQLIIEVSIKVSDEIVIDVIDTTAPVITLLGDATVDVEIGQTYNDAGATALDDIDGDITTSIVQTGTVDTDTLGTYTIKYNVVDSSGNAATEVTRTVNVVTSILPIVETLVIANSVYGSPSCKVDFKVDLIDLGSALPFAQVGVFWGETIELNQHGFSETDSDLGIHTLFVDYYLTPGTLYYYQAFAQNSEGVAYGEIKSFTTPSS